MLRQFALRNFRPTSMSLSRPSQQLIMIRPRTGYHLTDGSSPFRGAHHVTGSRRFDSGYHSDSHDNRPMIAKHEGAIDPAIDHPATLKGKVVVDPE
ncbi:hypothetical protein V8E54_005965 [Elaphomyces granulatus]